MQPGNHPDPIQVAFADPRLVASAGLMLPATLALSLGLGEVVDRYLDLCDAPGRANTGDKLLTLVPLFWPGKIASTTLTCCELAVRPGPLG